MLDPRLAWVSVGASRTDLEAASSASLLHSIYGSQASQLPFSDYESESSLPATQSEFVPRTMSPAAQRRHLSRPKSSPAAALLAREQQKKAGRPGSAVGGQRLRPATARSGGVRPGSAAQRGRQRPSSAHPGVGGAAPCRRSRPKTALGVHRRGSMVLLDVEEEEGEELQMGALRDTSAPVQLTRVPEYFDFWNMKPIQRREFGIPQHKRRTWQRPKSDYGNRLLGRRKKEEGDGWGAGRGVGHEQDLETLIEGDGSVGEGDGRGGKGGGADGGDGLDGSGRGGERGGSEGMNGEHSGRDGDGNQDDNSRGKGSLGGRNKDSDSDSWRSKFSWRDRQGRNKSAWGEEDGSEDAADDRYFKENAKDERLLPSLARSTKTLEESVDLGTQLPKLHPPCREFDKENELQTTAAKGGRQKVECARQILLPVIKKAVPSTTPQKALAATSWMDGRFASHKTTRFELPMDLKTLEAMTPMQYLRKHSIISDRRMAHCSKVFTKLDKDRDSKINREELLTGLVEVLYHCITEEQAGSVLELIKFPPGLVVDLRMFAAISCVTERMYQLNFLPIASREVIEVVDFEALEWKLRNCTISTSLRTLFSRL